MLKEYSTIFNKMMIFFDLCIILGSFYLGYLLRNKIQPIYPISDYLWFLPILLFIWGSLLYFFGIYTTFRTMQVHEILFIVFKIIIVGFVIFGSFTYILKIQNVSRILILFTFLIAGALIAIEKTCLLVLLREMRRKGFNFRNILIVGTGERAQNFIEAINLHSEWGYKIIGYVDADIEKVNQTINGYKVLGVFKNLPNIIHNNVVDEVIFIVPRDWLSEIREMLYLCESEGLTIHIAVDFFELKLTKAKQTNLSGFPLLTFESTPDKSWPLLIKRLFDIVASVIFLFISIPIFMVIAVIIKASSKGPIFFRQERCSLNGRRFMLYKIRTMVLNAEVEVKKLNIHNEMQGPVFKMENDPRLTKTGKFLRKFSLDELPQLWNVLKGDMSLVGPRPPTPAEVARYDNWHRRRLSIRPGITCLWQINGRNKITDFNEWMKLDIEYIDNWSLWLDAKILLKTIPVVLFGIGAK